MIDKNELIEIILDELYLLFAADPDALQYQIHVSREAYREMRPIIHTDYGEHKIVCNASLPPDGIVLVWGGRR